MASVETCIAPSPSMVAAGRSPRIAFLKTVVAITAGVWGMTDYRPVKISRLQPMRPPQHLPQCLQVAAAQIAR